MKTTNFQPEKQVERKKWFSGDNVKAFLSGCITGTGFIMVTSLFDWIEAEYPATAPFFKNGWSFIGIVLIIIMLHLIVKRFLKPSGFDGFSVKSEPSQRTWVDLLAVSFFFVSGFILSAYLVIYAIDLLTAFG